MEKGFLNNLEKLLVNNKVAFSILALLFIILIASATLLFTNLPDANAFNIKKKNFSYIVKIADFYYKKTADEMANRIKIELNLNTVGINKINENKFRVFLGPYTSLNTLQIAYNGIEGLGFENIEIINNE